MKHEQIRAELDEILAGLMTEKHMKQNDKLIISTKIGVSTVRANNKDWHSNLEKGHIKRRNNCLLKETFKETAKKRKLDNNSWRINQREAMQLLSQTKEWKDHHKLANPIGKKKKMPLMTDQGPMQSRMHAAKYFDVTPQIIDRRIKKYPDQYYYITKEEYTQLTGKEL